MRVDIELSCQMVRASGVSLVAQQLKPGEAAERWWPRLTLSAKLERLEGDDRAGVLDLGDRLHVLGDEMADVDAVVDVELGQDVVVAGGRIDLRGDLAVGKRACHRIGLAELALDLDEEGLHRALRVLCVRLYAMAAPTVDSLRRGRARRCGASSPSRGRRAAR